jgi:hypothetical protein
MGKVVPAVRATNTLFNLLFRVSTFTYTIYI